MHHRFFLLAILILRGLKRENLAQHRLGRDLNTLGTSTLSCPTLTYNSNYETVTRKNVFVYFINGLKLKQLNRLPVKVVWPWPASVAVLGSGGTAEPLVRCRSPKTRGKVSRGAVHPCRQQRRPQGHPGLSGMFSDPFLWRKKAAVKKCQFQTMLLCGVLFSTTFLYICS